MKLVRNITWFNRIYLSICVIGGVWCIAVGQRSAGAMLLAVAALSAVFVQRSLRGDVSDRFRIDSAQPIDERERAASLWGFAMAGMFAILMEMGIFIVELARSADSGRPGAWRLVAVALAWGVGNAVAKRRF